MSKSKVPAVLKTDTIAASLTQRLPLSPTVIAGEVVALNEEADRAEVVAARAVVNSAADAGKVADILRAINAQLALTDRKRKVHTDPIDSAKKQIMDLFRVPFTKFEKAKLVLQQKAGVWRRAEEARLTAEANARRIEKQQAAQAAAAAQSALGDADGAKQIIEEAEALTIEAEKPSAVGVYGGVLGGRKRSVGKVTDLRKFLAELIATQDPVLLDILASVEFSKSKLNALAALIHKGDSLNPNGFEAVEEDSTVVR